MAAALRRNESFASIVDENKALEEENKAFHAAS